MAAALMVQGATSSAGKSLLTTVLARHFARRGLRVAPFKGQNMSNNARVVDGGEIGVAQYLQAIAAGVKPDVRMNPVLVKPEADNRSQVIVLGAVHERLSGVGWRDRRVDLWPSIAGSLRWLLDEFDLVVVEGAGSPAEVNLRDTDLANMRVALLANAPVLLVADIDRGGAFAHLYGTWSMLANDVERRLVRGFVLNKFRGDPSLIDPGPALLEELTGVPTVGLVPWLRHGLPDEDGVSPPTVHGVPAAASSVAVVCYPTASNLDEFKTLEQIAAVRYTTDPAELLNADLVVLPGSKHVAADLAWLKASGMANAIRELAMAGTRMLAVCGGMQMLGERIDDRAGVDGSGAGLGLLPLTTTFAHQKLTRKSTARFHTLPPNWAELSGINVSGYEIRHGRTTPTAPLAEALPNGLGYVHENILGVYLHGLLEHEDVLVALFGAFAPVGLEQALDELTDAVVEHLDIGRIEALVESR